MWSQWFVCPVSPVLHSISIIIITIIIIIMQNHVADKVSTSDFICLREVFIIITCISGTLSFSCISYQTYTFDYFATSTPPTQVMPSHSTTLVLLYIFVKHLLLLLIFMVHMYSSSCSSSSSFSPSSPTLPPLPFVSQASFLPRWGRTSRQKKASLAVSSAHSPL